MSPDSLRRITQGWRQKIDRQRQEATERVIQPVQDSQERPITAMDTIKGQANLSTDGGMVLIRGEGWKEVKLTTVSEVKVKLASERKKAKESRRANDPWVKLTEHSYQAGLWNADEMARHQLVEGIRRGIDQCELLTSVNDGTV